MAADSADSAALSVGAYLARHAAPIERAFTRALNQAVARRAADPLAAIAKALAQQVWPEGGVGEGSAAQFGVADLKSDGGLVSIEDNWSARAWLQSVLSLPGKEGVDSLPDLLLAGLSLPPETGTAARERIMAMDTPEKFRELLAGGDFLSKLANTLCEAAKLLRNEIEEQNKTDKAAKTLEQPDGAGASKAHDAQEAMAGSKYAQAAETLTYGQISLFFSGLEGLVGPPHPLIEHGMKAEHCSSKDSDTEFTTSNYKTTTTSRKEWDFVADPQATWPQDLAPPSYPDGRGTYLRAPLAPSAFQTQIDEKNSKLSEMGEAKLLMVEFLGARLYTGPMFMKYNSVLRGLGAREERKIKNPRAGAKRPYNADARDEVSQPNSIELWCRKLCQGNNYTTTLHLINSAIIKLSKLTKVSKVYRGLSGRALPTRMLEPNEFSTRGGVEFAFLSTSTERSVAEEYSNGSVGVIFEIAQGLTDRGAEIAWLSQYTLEREVLFPPLSALEVLSWRQDGKKLVFEMRLSVNLTSEPIERVIGKFKNANLSLLQVLRSDIESSGAPALALLSLDGVIQSMKSKDHTWFNVAENYQNSTVESFKSFRDALWLLSGDNMWLEQQDDVKLKCKTMRKLATVSARSGEYDAAIEILRTLYRHMPKRLGEKHIGSPLGRDEARDVFFKAFPPRRVSPQEEERVHNSAIEAVKVLADSDAWKQVGVEHLWRLDIAAIFLAEGARSPLPGVLVRMIAEGDDATARAFAQLVSTLLGKGEMAKERRVLVLIFPDNKVDKGLEHRWKEAQVVEQMEDNKVVRVHVDGMGEQIVPEADKRVLPFNAEGHGSGALLREASSLGKLELVRALLAEGKVDVREADGEATTALHMATAGGHNDVCQLLLKSKGNMMMKNKLGKRPLDFIFYNHQSHLLRTSSPSPVDNDFTDMQIPTEEPASAAPIPETPVAPTNRKLSKGYGTIKLNLPRLNIFRAALEGDDSQLLNAVLSAPADVSRAEPGSRLTPLMLCCRDKSHAAAKIRILLEQSAAIDARSKSECTALMVASEAGLNDAVRILLEFESDPNAVDVSGATALNYAAFNGHAKVAELLLEAGADKDHMTSGGPKGGADFSPLHRACLHGHIEVVKMLLKMKADVEKQKADGYHPLLFAALQGHLEVARELIHVSGGKTVNVPNKDKHTPLMAASKNRHAPTVRLLLQARAEINARDNDEKTAMHYACEWGSEDCVEVLLKDKDVDVRVQNKDKKTALDIAVSYGDKHSISLLEEAMHNGL